MSYREIDLRSTSSDGVGTEIMYEIATCRADEVDLIRFNFADELADDDTKKLFSAAIRLLRGMKEKGMIQFFATRVDFISGTTEAVFLQNKYPEHFDPMPNEKSDGSIYIYVKI